MDIHRLDGDLTPEQVAQAHAADLAVQAKHGVNYERYWFNQKQGKVFCLCHAPDAATAAKVHAEAHGLIAEKVIEVDHDLIEGFLGGGEFTSSGEAWLSGGTERDPGIRTLLFTDLVGSTDLTQSFGDDASLVHLRTHDGIVREALITCQGREVKHTGDGIMASFISAAAAVRCALRIQHEFGKLMNREAPLQVRIGIAAGEPVERHNDLFGTTVQLAARLCSAADPGQVLLSSAIPELCAGKGLKFEEAGDLQLKGFAQTVRAFRAVLPEAP